MQLKTLLLATALGMATALAGCSTSNNLFTSEYGAVRDGGYQLPSIPIHQLPRIYHRQVVDFERWEKPGRILFDTSEKFGS